MKVEITTTRNRVVKDVVETKVHELIETERYDRTDNGVRNVCRVKPRVYTDSETKERQIFGYDFVFINENSINAEYLSLIDIKEGKCKQIGNYNFTYLIFKDETTQYRVDKAFFDKTFEEFKQRYID